MRCGPVEAAAIAIPRRGAPWHATKRRWGPRTLFLGLLICAAQALTATAGLLDPE